MLHFYNTRTRGKEAFRPIDENNVRMYVCGPTVYDLAHIGNARSVVVFDVLFRYLKYKYGHNRVTYVRNITDIDDKIIKRARELYPDIDINTAVNRLTDTTTMQFHADMKALNCLDPTFEPRATSHIEPMRRMIDLLIHKGFAYVSDNHVFFDSYKAPGSYGDLSGRELAEHVLSRASRNIKTVDRKSFMDFVLWKPSEDNEPAWPSPGNIVVPGRPGWHIECSAMAKEYLGSRFDIHGGGSDLIFPHHENERLQSCCAHDTDEMANYWLHNGLLTVNGEKMAKSKNNVITVNRLLQDWPPEVIRMNILKTHYRHVLDWTLEDLKMTAKVVEKFREVIGPRMVYENRVIDYLKMDLNTPNVISAMRYQDGDSLAGTLNILGIDLEKKQESAIPDDVQKLIAERNYARINRDWETADKIREKLTKMGIAVNDQKIETLKT